MEEGARQEQRWKAVTEVDLGAYGMVPSTVSRKSLLCAPVPHLLQQAKPNLRQTELAQIWTFSAQGLEAHR